MVIRRFLENFRSDEVVLIGRPTLKKDRVQNIKFAYPTLTIPAPPVGFRGEKLWRFLSSFLGVLTGLIAIRRYNPKAILAFYRDESSLLTGYWLHKITRLPLYSYFCDIYLENYPKGLYRKLAAWLQPRIFRDSKKVIVLTEAMGDYFKQKYKIDTVVLPHCNNILVSEVSKGNTDKEVCKIGYLGSINIDRVQSLQSLCKVIKGNHSYKLTYFTSTPKEYIQQQDLSIENSSIEFLPDDMQLMKELSLCDILFLPLTIAEDRGERITQATTGFPTKVIEYLLSHVPILVHSDKNSFGSKFIEDHQCGYVVYGGPDELIHALNTLKNDHELRRLLVENAVSTLVYFDGQIIANSFRNLLSR